MGLRQWFAAFQNFEVVELQDQATLEIIEAAAEREVPKPPVRQLPLSRFLCCNTSIAPEG
jgi:hypothetical protein